MCRREHGRRLSIVSMAVLGGMVLTAGSALAATKTVTVNDTDHIPRCQDIDQVKANAGSTTTKFLITIAGNANASSCNGQALPNIILNDRCNVSGTPGHASMACEGGGGGAAKISLNPSDNHQWVITFPTKEAKLPGTTSFKFQVYVGNSDSAGPATVKIG